MDRRHFLQSGAIAAGALCLDFQGFAENVRIFGKPRLTVGVLSDVHITMTEGKADAFRKALEYFRERKVDAVLVAGDIANYGIESELKVAADVWYDVFPSDRLPGGRHVEKLFIYGNHDVRPNMASATKRYGKDVLERDLISNDRRAAWKRCFHEDWEPVYIKDVKGYKFIGSHMEDDRPFPDFAEYMKSVEGMLDPSKPFFFFQHKHPKGTCSSPWVWGPDDGTTTEVLKAFPNAVALSGHSHTSLSDERTIWQDGFTSVGTASLSYIIPFGGRENSAVFASKEKVPSQMKKLDCRNGKQGMVMTVYDEYIVFERREFVFDEKVGPDWVLPLIPSAGPDLSHARRAKEATPPVFPEGAEVTFSEMRGKDRYGEEKDQVAVTFPVAVSCGTHPRAFDYEVQVEVKDCDFTKTMLTKRVFSKGFYLGETKDASEPVTCVFSREELPSTRPMRFVVRPCECFGRKGVPIESGWHLFEPYSAESEAARG